jgi:hypothetical protein
MKGNFGINMLNNYKKIKFKRNFFFLTMVLYVFLLFFKNEKFGVYSVNSSHSNNNNNNNNNNNDNSKNMVCLFYCCFRFGIEFYFDITVGVDKNRLSSINRSSK